MAASQPLRNVGIDALRGVAILLVLAHHAVIPVEQSGRIAGVAGALVRFGWSGVDLFFVLSGFLIGGLLFQEIRDSGQLDVRRFLVRRAFKIWPLYFALLGYVFVFSAFLRRKDGSVLQVMGKLLPNLVHAQNYLDSLRPHTWSLAVEEHFYLLLPVALLLGLRRGGPDALRSAATRRLLLGAIVLVAALRCLMVLRLGPGLAYFATHCRIDGLLVGVLLAQVTATDDQLLVRLHRYRLALSLAGLALVAPMLLIDKETLFVQSIGFTLLYAGYACLILAVMSRSGLEPAPSGPVARGLALVGFYSYPIYIWFEDLGRTPVGFATNRGLFRQLPPELRWLLAMALYAALACVLGAVMGKLVEHPALRLRERLFPSRARGTLAQRR